MSDLSRRLLLNDDGAHLLEYSLLLLGLSTALIEWSVIVATCDRLVNVGRLVISHIWFF